MGNVLSLVCLCCAVLFCSAAAFGATAPDTPSVGLNKASTVPDSFQPASLANIEITDFRTNELGAANGDHRASRFNRFPDAMLANADAASHDGNDGCNICTHGQFVQRSLIGPPDGHNVALVVARLERPLQTKYDALPAHRSSPILGAARGNGEVAMIG